MTHPRLSAAGTNLGASSEEKFGVCEQESDWQPEHFTSVELLPNFARKQHLHFYHALGKFIRFRRWISSSPVACCEIAIWHCPSIVAEHLVLHVALFVVAPFLSQSV